jgi:hypothetical protein
MTRFTCTCAACGTITFDAPTGHISGTPKQVRDMTHSYAQMFRNPFFAPWLSAQGFALVTA